MAQTILDVLQTPNPWLNASSVIGGSNTTGRDWISVDSWRPWRDFTFDNLMSIFQQPLSASWRDPPVIDPGSAFDHDIRDELSLDYFLQKLVFPIINRALERAAIKNWTPEVLYISPGSWCHGNGPPDWGLVAQSHLFEGKYNNLLPGDTKLSAKWQPWMEQSQNASERYQWTLPVSQVSTYAADSGCRYGYIITDQYFVALRFSKENMGLGSASSRPSRASQPSHQRVASGGTDLSSLMDSMSLDSFGAQSFTDNNLLNVEYQAPEYALISWSAAGRRRLTVKMALFCLCLMAAGGVAHIDSNYPPLNSWSQQGRHQFTHNSSGLQARNIPSDATIVNPGFDEDQYSDPGNLDAELVGDDQPSYHQDPLADLPDENQPTQNEQDTTASFDPSFAEQSVENLENSQEQEMDADYSSVAPETEVEAGPSAGPSHEVPRPKKEKDKQVVIERRDNSDGYKFVWKGHSDKVKTEKDDWDKDGNVWTLRKKYHGYIVWGYKPTRR